jgi:hypothetical protein
MSSSARTLGSNPTRTMDVCLFFCLYFPVHIAALRWTDPWSKESYRLFVRFIISELILKGNSSEEAEQDGIACDLHQRDSRVLFQPGHRRD